MMIHCSRRLPPMTSKGLELDLVMVVPVVVGMVVVGMVGTMVALVVQEGRQVGMVVRAVGSLEGRLVGSLEVQTEGSLQVQMEARREGMMGRRRQSVGLEWQEEGQVHRSLEDHQLEEQADHLMLVRSRFLQEPEWRWTARQSRGPPRWRRSSS